MHVPEGILSGTTMGIGILGASTVLTAAGTALGLRKIDYEQMPRVAMLSSAFFVASLIHVPVGVTTTHLVLNGLLGLVLGWAAFPAILIALLLQAVFFGFGGVTTLGLNTLTMALPAVTSYYLFHRLARNGNEWTAFGAGLAAGIVATVLGATLLSTAILLTGEQFASVAKLFLAVQLPFALVEGLVTASAVVFLRKVRPELLDAPLWTPVRLEVSDA